MNLNSTYLPSLNYCSLAIIGLGYVGLPLADIINKTRISLIDKDIINRKVIGYDLNENRIKELQNGFDTNNIISQDDLNIPEKIFFTFDKKYLENIDVFIITVPTPLQKDNKPDLSFLKSASKIVGDAIRNSNNKDNQIIIFESTVYPGATEEICIPIIEKYSCKKFNDKSKKNSFYCGYSPERINPGDKTNNINTIVKVTSGCNPEVLDWVDKFYGSFISAGTFKVTSIKVAEAAKIIENTQRDINIALVNELAMLLNKMNINSKEVLEAACSKWNFHSYKPGLVGGHCIGVDPYYLAYKAEQIGFKTNLISSGRSINDNMHSYLFEQILNYFKKNNINDLDNQKILLLGLSYKSNCSDIRNSQLIHLVKNIMRNHIPLKVVDPLVDSEKVFNQHNIKVLKNIPKDDIYSLIILALNHYQFENEIKNNFINIVNSNSLIIDLTYNLKGKNIIYL
tara:strand:+ start:2659 stop:4023 length:1365 start_codon:yes stop_codon:yes gene_type:complete